MLVIQVDVNVFERGSLRKVHEAVQKCCDHTEKEVVVVKIETDTTIAEAEFMNSTLTC